LLKPLDLGRVIAGAHTPSTSTVLCPDLKVTLFFLLAHLSCLSLRLVLNHILELLPVLFVPVSAPAASRESLSCTSGLEQLQLLGEQGLDGTACLQSGKTSSSFPDIYF